MVNHFRTLLLNTTGPRVPGSDDHMDAYIPEYTPRTVPQEILFIDHVLFGDCLTEDDKIQKVYQLIQLVTASEFAYAITEDDTRLTTEPIKVFAFPTYDSTLAYSVALLDDINDVVINIVCGGDAKLKKHLTEAGTYVDRLAAITVGYVRCMNASE